MTDWVRRALTRKVHRKGPRGRVDEFLVTPRDELVYGVKFAIGGIACLSGIEVASMAFLHAWNSEVFTAVSSLIGLVTGILIANHE
jgi:hypothetical protein